MNSTLPPSSSIPPQPVVQDMIGNLLRELRIARRLLALSKIADEQRRFQQPTTIEASAAHGNR